MESLGLLDLLIAGQVLPTDSVVHRLDPRTRLLGWLSLVVLLVGASRVGTAALVLGGVAGLVALARVPLRYAFQSLRLMLPWLAVVALIQVVFRVGDVPGCSPLVTWGWWKLTMCTLMAAFLTLVRFAGLVLVMSLGAWTLSVPDVMRALEYLVSPLDRLGLPAHELAMAGGIAMRFVPTMALELERLQKAQLARGGDLGGRRGGLVQRARATLPLLVPLFVLALRRAERLAEAMEARAYRGGRGRGRYVRLHFQGRDWLAAILIALFVAGVLFVNSV
jgi:energy-coupling factor transport system permease protein